MDYKNGLWDQIKRPPIQLYPLTMDDMTKTISEILSKTTFNDTYPIYLGEKTTELFWDLTYRFNHIDIYGVKQIDIQKGLFVYEGVIFDKFPDKYDTLFITYLNNWGSSCTEEIELVELTDTKIVFKVSFLIPKEETNITIEWN